MIITGPNGYGKSTILKIINYFCNDSFDKVLAFDFKKITIICDESNITLTKNKNEFRINNYSFPYPDKNWDKRRGSSPFLRRVGDDIYFDLRTSEKIHLTGLNGNSTQMSLFDEDYPVDKFLYAILENVGIGSSSNKLQEVIHELNNAFGEIAKIRADIGKVHFIQEQRLIEKRVVPDENRRYSQSRIEYVTVINENSEKLKSELAEIMKKHSSLSSELDSTYIKRLFDADQYQPSEITTRLEDLRYKQAKLQKYGLAEIQNASYLYELDQQKLERFAIELSIYLEDANAKYQVFESIIDKLELYEHIVNEKLTFKKMILSRTNGITVETTEGKELQLNDLSSGEQEILVLFYKLIFESDVNLLLIDEPEISLHIAWQKELMENLKSVVNLNRNIQVIIATHSPQIISRNWDLQIDLGGLHNG